MEAEEPCYAGGILMKEIHVGESVRVGTPSEEVRGTVVDLDRRPGYGRLIIDCDELKDPYADTGYVSKSTAKRKAAQAA